YWIEPTVFGDVHPQMRMAREEILGPVISVFSWRDEDAIIELANSLEYGLTAAVWTKDIKRAINAARRVQSGCVWINGVGNYFKGTPYGGLKNSGIGKESCLQELVRYTGRKGIQNILGGWPRPHPEEGAPFGCARLEGWRCVRSLPPCFETPRTQIVRGSSA